MTAPTTRMRACVSRQRGAVLFVSLIFLLALTLLGVMLARSQTTEERMALNDANHNLALESAGVALRFAELNLQQVNSNWNFQGNTPGLTQLDTTTGSVYSPSIWSNASAVQTLTTPLQGVSAEPEFIVEELPAGAVQASPGSPMGSNGYSGNTTFVYQITAHASGGDLTGNATLRSIYKVEY